MNNFTSIQNRKQIGVIILLLIFLVSFVNISYSQFLDNKGKDFIMAFMPNLSGSGYTVELHLTSDVSTTVIVEYPVNSPTFSTSVAVTPGTVSILTVPLAASNGWPIGAVSNNAVHAFATEEFVCYMINRRDYTSDAALALPVDVMNTEYIVMSYEGAFHGSDRSEFVVVAGFDNTTVTITPSNDMKGGFSAGVPFSITLNRGEGFLAQSLLNSGPSADLTGTIVSADRPVGVSNGNQCGNVPPGNTACDHLFEVAQPVQTWGDNIVATNLPNRPLGSVYRILASVDGTTISLDGTPIGTINKGEFLETGVITGSHEFTGTNPIYVAQFMTGQSQSGTSTGDPAMGNMIPSDQYLNSYTFSTVGGGQFAENFVTIIANNADVGSLTLDGSVVPAGDFTPIAGTSFSWATVLLISGTHTTASVNEHGITVEGYNSYDSYIYPGGARFQFINPVGDANPPICDVIISGNTATGSATDNRPSEDVNGNGILDPGEDLNGNGLIDEDTGIFFVVLEPGSNNLDLTVDPFTPGDGVVTFTVTLINPGMPGSGTVTATDGAGNTCSSPIQLGAGGADTTPPTCALVGYNPGPPLSLTGEFQDTESGLAAINVVTANNVTVNIPAFTPGTNNPVQVIATKIDNNQSGYVLIEAIDMAGNSIMCDPVYTTLSEIAPDGYELTQNYPNPFNPTTTIHFSVAAGNSGLANVRITIYDLSGREVKTLINEPMQSGQYAVEWDGTNSQGKVVAGGVYIYRMVAGNYVATRKMILMK